MLFLYCRGGDDTQREADADLPLDSLGAANQVLSYIQGKYLRRIGKERTSMCCFAFAIILMAIREYCLSLRHLIQADLVRADRIGDYGFILLRF